MKRYRLKSLLFPFYVFCFVSHTNKTIRQVIGIATLDEVTTSFGGNLFLVLYKKKKKNLKDSEIYQQLDASDLLMLYLDLLFSPSVVYNHFFSSSSSFVAPFNSFNHHDLLVIPKHLDLQVYILNCIID